MTGFITAHVWYIKILTWPRGFLVIFLHLVWFLCAQVSSKNCKTVELRKICNFDRKASESGESRNKQNQSKLKRWVRRPQRIAIILQVLYYCQGKHSLDYRDSQSGRLGELTILTWDWGRGEGVVLWPAAKSRGWPKNVFFLGLRLVWNFPFFFQLWLYLSIQNIRSFLLLILAYRDHPRHLASKVPLLSIAFWNSVTLFLFCFLFFITLLLRY